MESGESQVKFYFGIVTAMLAFAIIAGGLVLIIIRYQKRLWKKQQELLKIDSRHKQELLLGSIRSAEAERMRVAREVHDEIGSIFSTLSLSVNRLSSGDPQQAEHIHTSRGLIQSGIDSVRRISHAIVPFELELLGLEQTLENYFATMSTLANIRIDFETTTDLEQLNREAGLAVYRIFQELCSNCVKHAQASAISVNISQHAGHVYISYTDNGVGMSEESRAGAKGIGLRNIESRALLLNGSVEFVSAPGQGFACRLTVPILNNTAL